MYFLVNLLLPVKNRLLILFRSLLMVSMFLLSGDKQTKPFIHSDFLPYISFFEFLYGKKIENVSISFTSFSPESTLGICESYEHAPFNFDFKSIKIDRQYWEESSEYGKEILLFHELGHCVLNRDHFTDVLTIRKNHTIHASIMNPYIIDERDYIENRTFYLIELFKSFK